MRVALAPEDVERLGVLMVAARPTLRFRRDGGLAVLRVMPSDAVSHVDISDSALAPGLDLPEPDLWQGDAGVGVRLELSPRQGFEMLTGEMSTVFDAADSGHVAFVDAMFGALREATKPHVELMSGKRAPVRIGPAAERWFREDERRSLRDRGTAALYYRLRPPVSRS
jgi:hypothetical protein